MFSLDIVLVQKYIRTLHKLWFYQLSVQFTLDPLEPVLYGIAGNEEFDESFPILKGALFDDISFE